MPPRKPVRWLLRRGRSCDPVTVKCNRAKLFREWLLISVNSPPMITLPSGRFPNRTPHRLSKRLHHPMFRPAYHPDSSRRQRKSLPPKSRIHHRDDPTIFEPNRMNQRWSGAGANVASTVSVFQQPTRDCNMPPVCRIRPQQQSSHPVEWRDRARHGRPTLNNECFVKCPIGVQRAILRTDWPAIFVNSPPIRIAPSVCTATANTSPSTIADREGVIEHTVRI